MSDLEERDARWAARAATRRTLPDHVEDGAVGMSFHEKWWTGARLTLAAGGYSVNAAGKGGWNYQFTLVREPDNPHDPNAVAVAIPTIPPIVIAHVRAPLAAILAPLIDAGETWTVAVRLRPHPEHPDNPGLDLLLERQARPAQPSNTNEEQANG